VYRDLWSKVVSASTPISEALLKGLETHLCQAYYGKPIEQIRTDVMSGAATSLLGELESLGPAVRLLRRAFDWERQPGWNVWGRENLYQIAEYQVPEKLVLLHRALGDPDLLGRVLAGGREVEGGWVTIGTETNYPGLADSAVVALPFGEGHWRGFLAVLGPMRMDYGMVFSQVSQAAKALSMHLAELSAQVTPAG